MMGVLRINKVRQRGIKNSFFTQLKLMFICFLFLSISMNNITIRGEGFSIINEVETSLLKDGEEGAVLCEHNGYLYLQVKGYKKTVQIIDVRQPESPIVVGSYELEGTLLDFKISENIAYLLIELGLYTGIRYLVALVNITDPTNPVHLGSSALEKITTSRVECSEQISIYKNYTYVSSDELLIFDCSNRTLPVKVANYTSTGGQIHIKNDFLYLVSAGVKIFDLTDPVNPLLLGELNSTKHFSVGSGVYGNYVINAFRESGIQSYDCTDPTQPTICEDYDFPKWQIGAKGIVHDIDIVEDRLFAGGDKLYIFNIRKPQNLKRIAMKNIGDQNINRITVASNYIYLTIDSNIRIYSYVENSLLRNIGLGIGIGLTILVGALIFFKKKKTSKLT